MSERPPISPRSPRAALEPEQVPPPPKRSERARNPFVVVGNAIITIVLVSMIGVGAAYVYGKQKIEAPGPLQEDKIVNIPSRAGMTDIADILQREGVIDNNRWAFIGSVFALKARSELKPGEYAFQKNASLRDVIGIMVEGKVVQHAVTIPEGLTSEQIAARLSDNDIFAGAVKEMPREGTLLPETYKFPRGTTRDQVIQRMQQAQKRVLAEIWERCDLSFAAAGTGAHPLPEPSARHKKNVPNRRTMKTRLKTEAVEPAAAARPRPGGGPPADTNPTATTVKPAPAKKPTRSSAPPA